MAQQTSVVGLGSVTNYPLDAVDAELDTLISSNKVSEVTDWLRDIAEAREIAWLPVGSTPNNLATINMGTDPAAGLVERITNAIDAVLERKWVDLGEPMGEIKSPRIASAAWFGIPNGTLADVVDLKDLGESRDVAKRVQVVLFESEDSDRPTVTIRDEGVGLLAEQFESTILSLQGSNKMGKLFLAGAFGQGGSTALSYSEYTVIASRRSAKDGEGEHLVAATVVRYNAGDVDRDKHGYYEYLVDAESKCPLTFNASTESFQAGTLVRNVAMSLGKFKNVMTAPTSSLWYLSHHYLFDPVLPFTVGERRSGKNDNRTITGNRRRLTQGSGTQYMNSAILTYQAGSVGVNWWVLSDEESNIANYVWASKPIVITYNGQKQGDLPNSVIKNDLKLPYLDKFIVVQVDCDKLDNESRRQLFSTTRETLRDNPIMDGLRQLVVDTLEGDLRLKELDRERKQRFLSQVDSGSVDRIRKRLSDRVKTFLAGASSGTGSGVTVTQDGGGTGDGTGGGDADGGGAGEPRPPIPVQEPPTFIEITNSSPRKVVAGKRFSVQFRTDAAPSYFASPDLFVAAFDPSLFGHYSGTTHVQNGYGTAYFEVASGTAVGGGAQVILEIRPKGAVSVRHSLEVEVIAPPEGGGGTKGTAGPIINPVFVNEGDAFYLDHNWDKKSVAKVISSDDSVDIFVSSANENLGRLVVRAQRQGADAVQSIKDFYLEHISFHAMLASLASEQAAEQASGDDQNAPTERMEALEMKRVCETVCGMIGIVFDTIIK